MRVLFLKSPSRSSLRKILSFALLIFLAFFLGECFYTALFEYSKSEAGKDKSEHEGSQTVRKEYQFITAFNLNLNPIIGSFGGFNRLKGTSQSKSVFKFSKPQLSSHSGISDSLNRKSGRDKMEDGEVMKKKAHPSKEKSRMSKQDIFAALSDISSTSGKKESSKISSLFRTFEQGKERKIPMPKPGTERGRGSKKGKTNGVIVVLTQESRLSRILPTIQNFEEKFNKMYGYPYVFLNDVEFSPEYKRKVRQETNSRVVFAVIPPKFWAVPKWVKRDKILDGMLEMHRRDRGVPYWNSLSYRQMCRFQSGFIFRMDVLKPYDYFWRLDDDVHYFCQMNYDPIEFLQARGKVYGFGMAMYEYKESVRSLPKTIGSFIIENSKFFDKAKTHFIDYFFEEIVMKRGEQGDEGRGKHSKDVDEDDGDEGKDEKETDDGEKTKHNENTAWNVNKKLGKYNGCHFWTNMEIGDLNFFRGEKYQAYFDHLEKSGGFFYERWGDAPVRSLGLGLLVDKSKVQYFDDIGYYHSGVYRCEGANPYCVCSLTKDVVNRVSDPLNLDGIEHKNGGCADQFQQFRG